MLTCSRLRDSLVRRIEKGRTQKKNKQKQKGGNWGEKGPGPLFRALFTFAPLGPLASDRLAACKNLVFKNLVG